MVYPDLYNYDLSSLSRAREGEEAVVESVSNAMASLVERLDWERVVVVELSSGGLTSRVVDRLVESQLCVQHVVSLQPGGLGGALANPGWAALQGLLEREEVKVVVVSQTTDQVTNLLTRLTDLLGWERLRRAEFLAWSYIQTNDLLAEMAEQLVGLSLHLVADTEQEAATTTEAVAERMMESLGSGLSDYSARHCPDTETILACVRQYRQHLARGGQEQLGNFNSLDYNLLRLNSIETADSEEPLYILSGEWLAGRLVMYEEVGGVGLGGTGGGQGQQCLNTSQDYSAQLLSSLTNPGNIQTLWGSIALGICIFGVLIVVISAFYFILAVNRKQKTEYGSSKDNSRLLHYMLIIGLILLFLCPVPFILPVSQYSCILRHSAPTLAFSIILASVLVNLIATFRQTIYTVTPAQVWNYSALKTQRMARNSPSRELWVSLAVSLCHKRAIQIKECRQGRPPPLPNLLLFPGLHLHV